MALLVLGAGLTFFSDEWAFIEGRTLGDPSTWFEPHNEHWATLAILAYRALVETIGLGSYMPYLGLVISLHVIVAALVYTLVRRTSGSWPALGVGVVFLFFGSGFENLYWAFQIGFVGALAAGLGAIVAFDTRPLKSRRAAIGAGLLVGSLATQGGPGLICCLAVGLELLLDPSRRRMVLWLAIPAAVYAAWYLLIGRVGIESHQGLFSLGGLDDIPPVVATGLATTAGALVGVGTAYGGLVVLGAAIVAIAWAVRRRLLHLAPRAVACLTAAASLYALIALARSFAGPDVALYTRYTYISAALVIVGIAAQVGRPTLDARTKRAGMLAGIAVLTLSLIWNVRLLLDGRSLFEERAAITRAFVTAGLERPLPATTDPSRTLVVVPAPDTLERIVARYGSPLGDWLVPWAVPPIDPGWLARARQVVAEGAEIPLPNGVDQAP